MYKLERSSCARCKNGAQIKYVGIYSYLQRKCPFQGICHQRKSSWRDRIPWSSSYRLCKLQYIPCHRQNWFELSEEVRYFVRLQFTNTNDNFIEFDSMTPTFFILLQGNPISLYRQLRIRAPICSLAKFILINPAEGLLEFRRGILYFWCVNIFLLATSK